MQDTSVRQDGYRIIPSAQKTPLRSSPLIEFTIEITAPSDCKDCPR